MRLLIVAIKSGWCHPRLSGTENCLEHLIFYEHLVGCDGMWHASRHVGSTGWEFGFNTLSFGFQQRTTPQHIMYQMIGGRKFFSRKGLRFQEHRWSGNMISPRFMKPTTYLIQTRGGSELHEGIQKPSWGEILGTKLAYRFLHLHSSFHPFCIHSHVFTMLKLWGNFTFLCLLEYLINEVESWWFCLCKPLKHVMTADFGAQVLTSRHITAVPRFTTADQPWWNNITNFQLFSTHFGSFLFLLSWR